MNPEVIEEFDAAKDTCALIDAALRVDDGAAHFIVRNWATKGDVLLRQLLAITETLTRRVAQLENRDPLAVIHGFRNDIAYVERFVERTTTETQPNEGDQNND